MAFAALAGAVSGAGNQLNKNRQFGLDQDDQRIRRETANREQADYERQEAFREIMASRPDPTKIAQQIATQGSAALPADGVGPPAAAGPPPKYRDTYQSWKQNADNLAMRSGGLEGYTKFQEMEDALSRRMVLGYGLDAIRSLDDGDVGSAVKAANTALEVTPFDTGKKFVARNGKVYMEGADGELGGPYDADALRVFVEDNLKTRENYLDWRKQAETERGAKVREGIAGQQADTYSRAVDIQEGESPAKNLLRKAQAYEALRRGQALGAPEGEDPLAWNENNILKIEEMEKDALDGGLGFGGIWSVEGMKNSELNNAVLGAAKEIRVANSPNAMSHNDAAELARMAYFHDLPEETRTVPPNLKDTRVFVDDKGNFKVRYKGKDLIVPPEVGNRIFINMQQYSE